MADTRFKPKKRPTQAKNHIIQLVISSLLIVAAFFVFYPPQDRVHLGLDVQGGLSIVMSATKTDDSAVTLEEMSDARNIIEQRINLLGASEASVQTQGTNQLLVQIPGIIDQTQALSTIGQTGILEFVNLADVADQESVQSLLSGYAISSQELNIKLAFGEVTAEQLDVDLVAGRAPAGMYTVQYYNLDDTGYNTYTMYQLVQLEPGSYTPIFTGADIDSVAVARESDLNTNYLVNLSLNATATTAFAQVTRELYLTQGKIAIVLDGVIQSAPAVQSAITDGNVSISGNYTLAQANSLKTVLDSGSLPVTLAVISAQVVGPTLGQEALARGILVALLGLALVAIYLIIFYRGIGILTSASILAFAIFYLGILAVLSYFNLFALSLAGIAGIVLAIGVAADSSILVLERFKEEIRMGRSIRASSITGVKHAITTSIDADMVTAVSALAIFFLSLGSVRGFGLTLVIGVVCDILVMLLFKAPLIRLLAPHIITRHPAFWGVREDEDYAESTGEVKRGEILG